MPSPSRSFALGAVDDATRSVRVVASTNNPVRGTETRPDGTVVPRLEALETWDLARFAKNPVILWQHDAQCTPIGLADEVQQTERGLEMRINFAAANVEPQGEEAFKRVRAGLIRGVSVGFEFGQRTDESRNGVSVAVFRGNVLNEVSLVTIPADENALVDEPAPIEALTDEEKRQQKLSEAARHLAKARHVRTDADDVDRCDYAGRLGKLRRTPIGGFIVPARLARTGILVYRKADGTERRELRLPEECFRKDSIESLNNAPVTDIRGHVSLLDPVTFKERSLGHVADVRQDGDYLVGDIHLNDISALEDLDEGGLAECSAGYRCKLEMKSGTYNGERYDCIQRGIKYNHVAVLPPGRGRAGADVGLRLDSNEDDLPTENQNMPEPVITKTIIKLDGKDFEYGSTAHVQHLEARCDSIGVEKSKEAEKLKGENEALKTRLDASEKAAKKAAEDGEKSAGTKMRSRLRLLRKAALRFLADDGEDDEEKMDAKFDELDALSDREIHLKVIRSDADFEDFEDKGKSDDYVSAMFDVVIKKTVARTDSVDDVVRNVERIKRTVPSGTEADPEAKAREDMKKRNTEAGRKAFA